MIQNHYRVFPTHALYSGVANALVEMRANVKAPDALIAGAIFTGMSICSQGDIQILLPTGQITPGLLYVATTADSGERKTATDKLVLAPIYARDASDAMQFEEAKALYQADLRYWKIIDKAIQGKLVKALNKGHDTMQLRGELADHLKTKPRKPKLRRMIYQSVTERPLMEALEGDGNCVAILSDEGSIVLQGGATQKLGTLNKAWDNPSVMTFDRADGNIVARNPCVTVSFMIQEKLFQEFLNKRGEIARQSGFLARFLVSWPASTQGFRYLSLYDPVWEHLPKLHQRMNELLEATAARRASGDASRRTLSFSADAKNLFVTLQNNVESKLRDGGELASIRDFASKSMEIVGRMAGIMHHFEGIAGDVINCETLQRAQEIVSYYFEEYLALFGTRPDLPQDQKDMNALGDYLHTKYWLNGAWTAPRNEVRKNGPIRHQGRFEIAIQRHIAVGNIALRHEQQLKRKGRLWIDMNPAVFNNVRR